MDAWMDECMEGIKRSVFLLTGGRDGGMKKVWHLVTGPLGLGDDIGHLVDLGLGAAEGTELDERRG